MLALDFSNKFYNFVCYIVVNSFCFFNRAVGGIMCSAHSGRSLCASCNTLDNLNPNNRCTIYVVQFVVHYIGSRFIRNILCFHLGIISFSISIWNASPYSLLNINNSLNIMRLIFINDSNSISVIFNNASTASPGTPGGIIMSRFVRIFTSYSKIFQKTCQ